MFQRFDKVTFDICYFSELSCSILHVTGLWSTNKSDLCKHSKNLGVKDVLITIKKVGGEEVFATKVYQVPITSLESGAKFTVKAVGIPLKQKIYRECGPVYILIGIDHAHMHTGEPKKFGNVVARHSPLGWLLFGAMPTLSANFAVPLFRNSPDQALW